MYLKKHFVTFFIVALFASFFFKGTVFAADFKVTGTAIDSKDNPVVNAKVTATDDTTQHIVTTTTSDQNGYYVLVVPNGTYDITVAPPSGSGLQSTTYSHVTVSNDMSLHSNLNNVGNGYSNTNIVPQTVVHTQTKGFIGWIVIIILIVVIIATVAFALFKKKK